MALRFVILTLFLSKILTNYVTAENNTGVLPVSRPVEVFHYLRGVRMNHLKSAKVVYI